MWSGYVPPPLPGADMEKNPGKGEKIFLRLRIEAAIHIVAEFSYGICPAALAMPHLAYVRCTGVLHFLFHFRGGRGDIGEFILGDKGDYIERINPHFADLLCDIDDMVFINTRDIDRINFYDHFPLHRLFNSF